MIALVYTKLLVKAYTCFIVINGKVAGILSHESLLVCCFDALHPSQHFSVMLGRFFELYIYDN